MELEPYLLIQGWTPAQLQQRCQETLKFEEIDEDYVFYYMPLGAPFTAPDDTGTTIFFQAFIVSSHPDIDEENEPIAGEHPIPSSVN